MKHTAKQIALWAALLAVFFAIYRLAAGGAYTAYVFLPHTADAQEAGTLRVEVQNPDVLRAEAEAVEAHRARIFLLPGHAGESDVRLIGQDGQELGFYVFQVTPLGTVIDRQTAGFSGDTGLLMAVTLLWLGVGVIMLRQYFQAKGPAYYAQSTVYYSGFSLFALISGGLMLLVTARRLLSPADYSMQAAYDTVNRASTQFMMFTMPLVLLFGIALAASNLALLRHEKPSSQNVLGLLCGLMLILGEALGLYLFSRDFMGSEWEGRIRSTLDNSYATVFVYFECMLAGAVICGVTAAKRRPAPDKDVIIILGCWFRPDGSLPPLLRGRVDSALAFFRRQQEISGRPAVFIPSGGRGPDEPMPEAEAMRRYLAAQGIPPGAIYPEDQSKSTLENMAYSKRIVDRIAPRGNVLFVTTGYHVFRSGICAAQAGLRAEGIGGKTAWWYWPNAFLRECAALLIKHWREELVLLILLMAGFGALSMIV